MKYRLEIYRFGILTERNDYKSIDDVRERLDHVTRLRRHTTYRIYQLNEQGKADVCCGALRGRLLVIGKEGGRQ